MGAEDFIRGARARALLLPLGQSLNESGSRDLAPDGVRSLLAVHRVAGDAVFAGGLWTRSGVLLWRALWLRHKESLPQPRRA